MVLYAVTPTVLCQRWLPDSVVVMIYGGQLQRVNLGAEASPFQIFTVQARKLFKTAVQLHCILSASMQDSGKSKDFFLRIAMRDSKLHQILGV